MQKYVPAVPKCNPCCRTDISLIPLRTPSTVTQIPLEPAPRQQEPGSTPPSNRPPWVRPVRKKASSNARSPAGSGDSPLNHGSPEDFQPTDAFLDHLNSPTPQAGQQPQPFGVPPLPAGPFGMASAPFMDAGAMMQTDLDLGGGAGGPGGGAGGAGMSTADIMAFLNSDPAQLDMSAILASPDLGSLDHANGFYHLGTPASGASALSP